MKLWQPIHQQFEKHLGYHFKNKALLLEALMHSTYVYEHRAENLTSNERLEFLGDAVLDLAVSDALFRKSNQYAEGFMTKTRALVVCENSLMVLARELDLGSLLFLGKGETATGGHDKPSNLANAMEAVFGAIYLDAGFDTVKQIILNLLDEPIKQAQNGSIIYDYKSRLLEFIQGSKSGSVLKFSIISEEGPVHERIFTAGVLLDECLIASGIGSSKKEAEQQAAQKALDRLDEEINAD